MATPSDPRIGRSRLDAVAIRLSYMRRVLGLIWKASRGWTVSWGLLLAVQGLMPVALVYLTKPLVDGLQATVGHGVSWTTVRPVLTIAVAIGSVMLLTELFKVCLEWEQLRLRRAHPFETDFEQ